MFKKVAIVGSKSISDRNYIISLIEKALLEHSIGVPVFLCRNKTMTDAYAEYYANSNDIECIPYPNHTNQYLMDADLIIGIWDGSDDEVKCLQNQDKATIYL